MSELFQTRRENLRTTTSEDCGSRRYSAAVDVCREGRCDEDAKSTDGGIAACMHRDDNWLHDADLEPES